MGTSERRCAKNNGDVQGTREGMEVMMECHGDDGLCPKRAMVFPADVNGRRIQRAVVLLMVGLLFSGCGLHLFHTTVRQHP